MKVFWWQAGLHLEPESSIESESLKVLADNLKLVDISQNTPTGPINGDLRNENSVVGVHKLP